MWDKKNDDKKEENHQPISFENFNLFHDDVLEEKIRSQKNVDHILWTHHEWNTRIVHPHEWRVVDDYPHIARMIDRLIPYPEQLYAYLKELLNPDFNPERARLSDAMWKPKERIGFPPSMLLQLSDMLHKTEERLKNVNKKLWIEEKKDVWSWSHTWNKAR